MLSMSSRRSTRSCCPMAGSRSLRGTFLAGRGLLDPARLRGAQEMHRLLQVAPAPLAVDPLVLLIAGERAQERVAGDHRRLPSVPVRARALARGVHVDDAVARVVH